jgi:staphyloferrin B biosynthesis citrate synthase
MRLNVAQASHLKNPVKEKLRAGGVALGITVRVSRTPDIARIAKTTGHDFIFIDGQHSIFNLESTVAIAHAALGIGMTCLVRVQNVDDPNASLLLDNGAAGIIYPDVSTPAQAQKAVDMCKFPPIGKRSVVGGYPHFDFASVPLSESVPQLNEHCLVVCMIETVEGLNNVEKIAAVKGVDVIHLGSNDLLANMGKPGKFDDPDIVVAQERVIKAARANNIIAGCGGNRDVERQVAAIKRGALFVTTQTDVGFLSASASQWTQGVRKALG